MSCSTGRLVSYYSDKVNIYNSNCFIPLPNYRTCPPPSMIILQPAPTNNCNPYGQYCNPSPPPAPPPAPPPQSICSSCGPS